MLSLARSEEVSGVLSDHEEIADADIKELLQVTGIAVANAHEHIDVVARERVELRDDGGDVVRRMLPVDEQPIESGGAGCTVRPKSGACTGTDMLR